MILLYLLSRFIKNNSIVDIFWGIGFALVAIFSLFFYKNFSPLKIIFNVAILLWGARLALHIFIKNKGKAEDFRYANWRKEWGKTEPLRALLQIYFLQGAIMFVKSMFIVLSNSSSTFLIETDWIFVLGSVVFLVGFLIEAIADYQKSVFKKSNPAGLMKTGLWAYSRHPNYFGEVVLWFGLFLMSVPFGYWYLGLLSFLIIFYLIRFVSGVPMLEKSKKENAEYQIYSKEVPVFFPYKF
jgi:steroid 5-alpha reductase family enzyme